MLDEWAEQRLRLVLGRKGATRAALVLAASEGEATGRQIAQRAGIAPATAYPHLLDLEASGILLARLFGGATMWRMAESHMVGRLVLELAKACRLSDEEPTP